MIRPLPLFVSILLLSAGAAAAQTAGTAGGTGTIVRFSANPDKGNPAPIEEKVAFAPRFSYAYTEKVGATTYTFLVLSEKEPPIATLHKGGDRAEARRVWCEKEKASFVAVMLEPDFAVNLYFLCPGNGNVNTEMVNTANGLESVALTFSQKDGKRLKGTLRTGQGSCSSGEGPADYCEKTGDFVFDAPFVK